MKERWPRHASRIYRGARGLAYRMLDPLDAAARAIMRMGRYPPLHLRRHVSYLGHLDGPGFEFVAYMKLLLGLEQGQRIWDAGCGCGLLELVLEREGWRGDLVGTDIHKPSIEWAQRRIASRAPHFRFMHADIRNDAYWPRGKLTAAEWFRGFVEDGFDAVIAKSLFTQILAEEMDVYLEEIGRRLKPGGKALLTFHLLESGRELPAVRRGFRLFRHPNGVNAVRRPYAPTAFVALEEDYLDRRLSAHGLRKQAVHYGWWSGRENGLSSQDMVIVSNTP